MGWDSIAGQDSTPQRVGKLPEWASAGKTADAHKRAAGQERFRKVAASQSIHSAIDQLLDSDEAGDRIRAVYLLTALDELPRLAKALHKAKHRDVCDTAVLALRHWIGRAPGQDQRLYDALLKSEFSPVEAETVMQLLHGFTEADTSRPETYETLIAYLNHNKVIIRGLAHWHLSRLAPEGRELGYDPVAAKDARTAAIAKWKQLIPSGKLPPRPREKEKE